MGTHTLTGRVSRGLDLVHRLLSSGGLDEAADLGRIVVADRPMNGHGSYTAAPPDAAAPVLLHAHRALRGEWMGGRRKGQGGTVVGGEAGAREGAR